MKSLSGRDLARLVESRGWQLLRIHDSHHIYGKSGNIVRLSIPIHDNKPLKIGLLRHLLKMAGFRESDLD
jgi:predicted RNA binding protein YcfA (HicA-like mRNA interferase family)